MSEENQITQPIYNEEEFIEPPSLELPWKFILFGFLVFILSLILFIGLKFGYLNYLDSKNQEIDKKISEITNSIDEVERENLIIFYSQIFNLKEIIKNHNYPSKLFSFLEDNTLAKVYYSDLNWTADKNVVSLKGLASDLNYLSKQLEVFQNNKNVSYVNLIDLNFFNNQIGFNLEIGLKSDFLNNK